MIDHPASRKARRPDGLEERTRRCAAGDRALVVEIRSGVRSLADRSGFDSPGPAALPYPHIEVSR
jgi:hypothetical protein